MLVTANGVGVASGYVNLPKLGQWRAVLETQDGTPLSGKVRIVCGDLALIGDIVPNRGGVSAGVGRWTIKAAIELDNVVKPRSYHSENGVKLSTVLGHLLNDAGFPLSRLDAPPDRRLGSHVVRQREHVAALLTHLCGSWYVSPVGRLTVAPRPGSVAPAGVRVLRRDMARRVRICNPDLTSSLMPGNILEGDIIGRTVIYFGQGGETFYVYGGAA